MPISRKAQAPDADLTAIAGLDSSTSGAIASDGSGWIKKTYAQFKTALGLTKSDVGLSNVDNVSDADKPVSTATQTALDAKLDDSQKGAANGLAELDAGGLVPTSQLPSYVDDVIEAANFAALPGTGATGKIYVTLDDNKTYRWSGSAYVEISASLALGETSSTAYRGDRGKTAYDHSQLTSGNPHAVTKSDVGLSNVTNDAQQPLDSDLTAIAGLSPTNDDVLQRKSGAWTNRTLDQLTTDLALAPGDIAGFDAQVRTSRLDQMATPTASVAMGSQRITGLSNASSSTDAATKTQVDANMMKFKVQAATTAAITLSGTQTIDGVALVANDRCLVKNQASASSNGIWSVQSGSWTRVTDADASAEISGGILVYVEAGTVNQHCIFAMTTTGSISIGSTSLNFAMVAGALDVDTTAGDVSTTKHGYVPKAPNDAAKFLDGTGAFSTPAGGSSVPRMTFSTFLETSGRFQQGVSGSGAAHTFSADGVDQDKGTTTTGGADISVGQQHDNLSKWDKNPHAWFECVEQGGSPASNSWDWYFTFGSAGGASGLSTTTKHMGFDFKVSSGTPTLLASNANGTTQTLSSDFLGALNEFQTHVYFAKMTSGTKIEFYVDGVLKATHTTNLPSGGMSSTNLLNSVTKASAGTTQSLNRIKQWGCSYEGAA